MRLWEEPKHWHSLVASATALVNAQACLQLSVKSLNACPMVTDLPLEQHLERSATPTLNWPEDTMWICCGKTRESTISESRFGIDKDTLQDEATSFRMLRVKLLEHAVDEKYASVGKIEAQPTTENSHLAWAVGTADGLTASRTAPPWSPAFTSNFEETLRKLENAQRIAPVKGPETSQPTTTFVVAGV